MNSFLLRHRLAQESAKIMVQEHIDDYLCAKQKAAERLGVRNKRDMPGNEEIAAAVLEYRRLFASPQQVDKLRCQREAALNAMKLFADFEPRLVGSVLYGTANTHSDIVLHLFSDSHEDVAFFLMARNMPYQLKERKFASINKTYPAYRFVAGDDHVLLVVFPYKDMRQPPPDPVDGKPMRRADAKAVQALLND
jgi:hypothetical protein